MMIRFRKFAIVPAAGRSSRMGTDKLLLKWRGQTVIQHVVAAWQEAAVDDIVVATRPDNQPLIDHLLSLPVQLVVPAAPPADMKRSVQLALLHLQEHRAPDDHDAWLLAPADMPRLSTHVITKLIQSHQPNDASILVPIRNKQRGHPVLFPWRFRDAVFDLPEDRGVNHLLSQLPTRQVEVSEMNDFGDLDTPDDYRGLLSDE